MPVAEARSIASRLVVLEEDPEGDLKTLEQVAAWADRFTPLVGLEQDPSPESLLLDLTGCAACFHGESQLLARVEKEFAEAGWKARLAIADTIGAAWALAHSAASPCCVPQGETEKTIASLPLSSLRLTADVLEVLSELGIDCVSDLMSLQRAGIPERFGAQVLTRLDQALGHLPEVLVPYHICPELRAGCSFDYATDRRDVLCHAVDLLTEKLQATLKKHNLGARQVMCRLYVETAKPLLVQVELFRASRSKEHIASLLRARLEKAALDEPVCGMCVRVAVAETLSDLQSTFFEEGTPAGLDDLSDLIDSLSSRFGKDSVTRARVVPDPQPEYACCFETVLSSRVELKPIPRKRGKKPPEAPAELTLFGHRPLQLLPSPRAIEVTSVVPEGPPIQFRWSGTVFRIMRARGPERIEAGWWRGQDVRRDYYAVKTHTGVRYWIYRRREDGRWFMHGCFD
jgi:protein ImuB